MDIFSEKIIPYYQPIIAVDTGKIYAFEVLGRYIDDNGDVKSLGGYFADNSVSSEDALKVDRIVRKQALKHFSEQEGDYYLFINLRLAWIADFANRPDELPTVVWAKEFGVDLSRLVIEITEEEFYSDKVSISEIVDYYRKLGCRIAVDDFGQCASNIERLALLEPDIVKLDMSFIHKCTESYHIREYIKAMTMFAERVGIRVLYEGIESQEQLEICIGAKGRYYQGFFLAKPQSAISSATADCVAFSVSLNNSIVSLHQRFDRVKARRDYWDRQVDDFLNGNGLKISRDEIDIYKFACILSEQIKRMYLCDKHGNQLSNNYESESGKITQNNFTDRNWSWRGYFQEAMIMFHAGMKSHLTAVYRDASSKEKIYTYIHAINTNLFLFIDILYSETADIEMQEGKAESWVYT